MKYSTSFLLAIQWPLLVITAQNSATINLISNEHGAHIAQDLINLKDPGTLSYSSALEGNLRIDTNISLPTSYSGQQNYPFTSSFPGPGLNIALHPGAIPGNGEVDGLGAFNYNLPISLPPG